VADQSEKCFFSTTVVSCYPDHCQFVDWFFETIMKSVKKMMLVDPRVLATMKESTTH